MPQEPTGLPIGGSDKPTGWQQEHLVKVLNQYGLDYNDPMLKNKMLLLSEKVKDRSEAEKLRYFANNIAMNAAPRAEGQNNPYQSPYGKFWPFDQ